MMSNGENRHGASQHVVNHCVRESTQYAFAIAFCVRPFGERRFGNAINGVEHLGPKRIRNLRVALTVPSESIANVVLSRRSKLNNVAAHNPLSLRLACPQGTARTDPERSSFLRRRTSSAQASLTDASLSPSKLSSSASATAERSSGVSASASSIKWSTRAFMRLSLAVSGSPLGQPGLRPHTRGWPETRAALREKDALNAPSPSKRPPSSGGLFALRVRTACRNLVGQEPPGESDVGVSSPIEHRTTACLSCGRR